MIGKRKREVTVVSREEADSDSDSEPPVSSAAAHDVFRNFFESRFEPLEPVQRPAREEDSSVERHIEQDKLEDTSEDASEEDSEKEWSGISEDGGEEDSGQQAVEVVEFTDVRNPNEDILDKRVLKSFMSSKPPSLGETSATRNSKSKHDDSDTDDAMDAENLKNDLALQRLLKESHLLEDASNLNPTGKNRHKAIDLRIQSLGGTKSIYEQKKMPKSHREGIQAKAAKREERRRREARENGIILEKPTKTGKKAPRKRDRGIGGPSIGKFTGATLRLSERDVADLRGSKVAKKGRR